jgi:cysteinyl-tRNA synthetase
MLKFYNTLTRQIEDFIPINPSLITYYSCGPTVYDYAHIGHARTYVFADSVERVLTYNGFPVKRVMNITDVGHLTSDSDSGEDKMEKGASREKKSVWEIARVYTEDFFAMMDALNIKKPDEKNITRATEYIPQMIQLVGTLEKKGFTYTIGDGVYFDTSKFPDYGKLTGRSLAELEKGNKMGARVEAVSGKKHPLDFALWKLTPNGIKRQMEWDSPWGKGFPGWHIECSAMILATLGDQIDIHTGGVDHIPIHHTNEIAQSEAATGKSPFVRYWVHGEHLLVDGKKMSKSLGNFYRLKDIVEKGFDPIALRYLFLTASYHQQMNFTWKALESAQNALDNLRHAVAALSNNQATEKNTKDTDKLSDSFKSAVNDDLNMPQALGVVWETVKSDLSGDKKRELIGKFDSVLGLGFMNLKVTVIEEQPVLEEVKHMVKERENLRKEKKFSEADTLRKKLKNWATSSKIPPMARK